MIHQKKKYSLRRRLFLIVKHKYYFQKDFIKGSLSLIFFFFLFNSLNGLNMTYITGFLTFFFFNDTTVIIYKKNDTTPF
jgi:hypothetical protein